ncbi:MAG: hypothetical protein HQL66_06415 [Magnetococcales bacterium]|nr:hypothetical protein [Magnetococcales bacterium]
MMGAPIAAAARHAESTPDPARMAEELRQVPDLMQAGALAAAAAICERALLVWPDNPGILTGLVGIHQLDGAHDRARELTIRGLRHHPDHAPLHYCMGDIAKAENDLTTALSHFQEVVRLDPDHVEGHYQCGAVLAACDRPTEAVAAFRRAVVLKPGMIEAYQSLAHVCAKAGWKPLASFYVRLCDHHRQPGTPAYQVDGAIEDTYFLDRQKALATAQAALTTKVHQHFPARQLCYHSHADLANAGPETLVYCPANRLVDFLLDTRLRLPTAIDFDPGDDRQREQALVVAEAISLVPRLRGQVGWRLANQSQGRKPDPMAGGAWRVYMIASRWTTVMQYAAHNTADALRRLGCEVRLVTETNDLEMLDGYHFLREMLAFNPGITFNINRINNQFLHPDVVNIVWYQDPMAEIREGKPLPWRPRDIVLSAYPEFDDLIRATGASQVRRQDLCVDTATFRNVRPRHQRRKVVFVGSAHHHFFHGLPGEREVIETLRAHIEAGADISLADSRQLACEHGLDPTYVSLYIHAGVVRNRAVEWLCELAPELEWEVEIYGRHWDELPIVAPYFRGELPHGAAVAALYNEARYALAAHPQMVKSQRLAEVSACGCLPVLFDDRRHAEGPLWEDEILFFKTKADLRACLSREPKSDPTVIARAYTYDALARRILQLAAEGYADQRPMA